jgi:hypothetical protein
MDKFQGAEYLASRAMGIDYADQLEEDLRKGKVIRVGNRFNLMSFYWEVRAMQEPVGSDWRNTQAVPRKVFVIEHSRGSWSAETGVEVFEQFTNALERFNAIIDQMARNLALKALDIGDDK